VETNAALLLEIVYEPIFKNFSYGFRPRRNCHQAIIRVLEEAKCGKVNYVVEADIRFITSYRLPPVVTAR
jgi:retron-type reverse transcriptase